MEGIHHNSTEKTRQTKLQDSQGLQTDRSHFNHSQTLTSIVAENLSQLIEQHHLLPKTHFGGR